LDQPLVANQIELSVVHAQLINDGITFNRDELGITSRSEGTLEFCRLHDITVQAWSPLAGGAVSGRPISAPDARIEETSREVASVAEERGVSKEAIVIGWLLRHPAGIQPIIGTTDPGRIAAACQAVDIVLSREEWYRLLVAGRGGRLP
jgi:predicted oxidoreductase